MSNPVPTLRHVPLTAIRPHPDNPRTFPAEDPGLRDLSQSIAQLGVLSPILLRPLGKEFQLIAGERRWRAAKLAKLSEIPALVRTMEDAEAIACLITENLQRENLGPLEEARSVTALIGKAGWTVQDVAAKLGKSLGWVAQRRRLESLHPKIAEMYEAGKDPVGAWPIGVLLALAQIEPKAQWALCQERQFFRYEPKEAYTVVANLMRTLNQAPWDLADEALVPQAGSCTTCPKRSSRHPGLFEELEAKKAGKGERCLDPLCWAAKMKAFKEQKEAALRVQYPNLILVNGSWRDGTVRQDKALPEWDYTIVAKSTPGAVPALVVSGKGEGSLRWVQPNSTGRATKARGKQADGKPAPVPLEERRAALLKRRQVQAVDKLKEAIDAYDTDQIVSSQIVILIATFGTDRRHVNSQFDQAWIKDLPRMQEDGKALHLTLWESVYPVLLSRLAYQGTATDIEKLWFEAELQAAYLGLDLKAMFEQACAEIPEPKAWVRLRPAADPEPSPEPTAKASGKASTKASSMASGKGRKTA